MSGADFCAVYRGRTDFPAASLIGMSRDHRREQEMVAAGADRFLCKPFPMTSLRAALTSELPPAAGSGLRTET
jgi:DNA-binding response OmpR family regulator